MPPPPHLHEAPHVCQICLDGPALEHAARIVDEHVNAPLLSNHQVDDTLHCGGVRHVELVRVAAKLLQALQQAQLAAGGVDCVRREDWRRAWGVRRRASRRQPPSVCVTRRCQAPSAADLPMQPFAASAMQRAWPMPPLLHPVTRATRWRAIGVQGAVRVDRRGDNRRGARPTACA